MVDDVVNENIYLKKNRNKSSHLHGTYTQMNEKEKNHFYLCLHCTVMYDVRADSTGFLCVEIFHSHFLHTHLCMKDLFSFRLIHSLKMELIISHTQISRYCLALWAHMFVGRALT